MISGIFIVSDPEEYQEITGLKGDVPDKVWILPEKHNPLENKQTLNELWDMRDQGRTQTVSVKTVRLLKQNDVIEQPILTD